MSTIKFSSWILNILYPPKCPYCKKSIAYNEESCKSCSNKIKRNGENRYFGISEGIEELICCSPLIYTGVVRKAIINFKFSSRTSYATAFANSLFRKANEVYCNSNFDFVTCIPLSRKSKRKRGFNQSELLAKRLSRLTDIPFKHTLLKIKENKPQHTLSLPERKINIQGIYALKNEQLINGKNILLLDDIVTTGSTLVEASKVLYRSGANSVKCIALSDAKNQEWICIK